MQTKKVTDKKPLETILRHRQMQIATSMTEVVFQSENAGEQVVWRSFLMQPLDYMQVEAIARKSLRLGKKRWRVKSINKWPLRGW